MPGIDWAWIRDMWPILVGMGMGVLLMFAGYRVTMRWIAHLDHRQSGGARELADLRAAVEQLRAQLAEHQDVRQRLLELEERADFAERMLASAHRERLGASGRADR